MVRRKSDNPAIHDGAASTRVELIVAALSGIGMCARYQLTGSVEFVAALTLKMTNMRLHLRADQQCL
jgi:hypothetical protein